MTFETGMRVRFTDKVTAEQFGADAEEWASNPKTGTVMDPAWNFPGKVFVRMDQEWKYNEKDMICWLQGEYEIMDPDEIEEIQ